MRKPRPHNAMHKPGHAGTERKVTSGAGEARVGRLWSQVGGRPAVVLLVVWIVSAGYLFSYYQLAGVPHDSGSLGHAAERVLQGELPHRDFDSLYTGGLAFLHAMAFRLLGVKLLTMQWCLLIASLLFVPAVYAIALRVCAPIVAGAVTLLALVWSVPNYFVGLPSWYNLFFAVFGTWALIKHLETGQRRWLLLAGACAGISLAIKLIGLYFVAAVLLYMLYREQTLSEESPGEQTLVYSSSVSLGLIAFMGVLVKLVSYWLAPMEVLHYVVPGVALSMLLLWNEWRCGHEHGSRRLLRIGGMVGPFLAGMLLAVGPLVIPYLATSSLDALCEGLFVQPLKRFGAASAALPDMTAAVALLPMAGLLAVSWLRLSAWVRAAVTVVTGATLGLWLIGGREDWAYQAAWISLRGAAPLAVLAGVGVLWAQVQWSGRMSSNQRQMLFLMLAMGAMVSLVQVPYPQGVYLLYAAPAIILALCFVLAGQGWRAKALGACFFGFYFLFALCWVRGGYPCSYAVNYVPLERDSLLEMKRGGLLTDEVAAKLYNILIGEIRKRTAPGDFIYAAPDCPEVYFLSGRKNPTRTFYDFFDEDYGDRRRSQRILKLLEQRRVNVVVLRGYTEFSQAVSPDLRRAIAARYPYVLNFRLPGAQRAPLLELRWRKVQARSEDLVRPSPRGGSAPDHRSGA